MEHLSTGHHFSSEILKSCDIRGIYGRDLHSEDAYHIGRAFGTFLRKERLRTCAVGYDVRISSPELADRLIKGLRECGIDVTMLGMIPSPTVYFAVKKFSFDAGLVVTASHNPAKYNGFKFVLYDRLFHGPMIEDLGRISEGGLYTESEQSGALSEMNPVDEYISYLRSFRLSPEGNPLKIVWDPGNGATAVVLPRLVETLPGEHRIICETPDGSFPNHHPDPNLPENMEMLRDSVLDFGADCGIAFDGDGDRIGVVDGKGRILQGDQLLVLYARDFLRENPGETVMSEVKASSFFYDDIRRHGGIPLMWKVGHSNQKEKMRQEGIGLAGETSGHIFFMENFGFDDGLFAAIKLLNILGKSPLSLTEIAETFPKFHDSGELRLQLDGAERNRLVKEISSRLREAGRNFIDLDGVRVPCADGFWMLRASNTQPHITIRCEAASSEGLKLCLEEMREQVKISGIDFDARSLR